MSSQCSYVIQLVIPGMSTALTIQPGSSEQYHWRLWQWKCCTKGPVLQHFHCHKGPSVGIVWLLIRLFVSGFIEETDQCRVDEEQHEILAYSCDRNTELWQLICDRNTELWQLICDRNTELWQLICDRNTELWQLICDRNRELWQLICDRNTELWQLICDRNRE